MKTRPENSRWLAWCEHGAAILMTVCAVILHVRVLLHAGPLWRDEINGLNVALMAGWREIWQSIAYYPFPIFHDLLMRFWIALGFGSDFQLRVFAFLIGLLLLATIWIGCQIVDAGERPPLLLLSLLGLNPVVLQNGDWLRPYALAMIFLILLFALIWRIASGSASGIALTAAILAASLSAQSVFQSALLVFAICIAGIAVSIRNNQRRNTLRILAVGLIAGVSLLPYFPVIQQARDWTKVAREESSFIKIAGVALGTLTGQKVLVAVLWVFVVGFVVATALIPSFRKRFSRFGAIPIDGILFAAIAIGLGAVGTIVFVSVSGWLMPRYFLPFVAVAAMCTHLVAQARAGSRFVRVGNVVISFLIAIIFLPAAWLVSAQRDTTCDWVGESLSQGAESNDLIVVTSFPFGISFARYYHGTVKWRTIPDVADHTQHRWDQARETMKLPDPLRETLSEIEAALKSGKKVFLVGALPAEGASNDAVGYLRAEEELRTRLAKFLKEHVATGNRIPLGNNQPVQELENLPLFVCSGWRE